ncbi:hypothetical protein ZOSMA_1G03640 [Zostera marina]|uniref:Uncharacterized protein n=1 Tax=Zostera marina TaxID=29655 RepID=A0A0K9PN21_ZOSMR|nr:hypothetical protein ZOSMA_1G03640 [Zostera marina]
MLCFTIDCFWKKGRPAKSGCTLVRSKNMLLSFSQTVDRQITVCILLFSIYITEEYYHKDSLY